MAIDCVAVSQEELKRLRDIQRLLQFLAKALGGSSALATIGLEEIL